MGRGYAKTTILFHREHIDQALIHWILGGYHGGVLFQEQRALQVSLVRCLTWLKWQSGTMEDPGVYPHHSWPAWDNYFNLHMVKSVPTWVTFPRNLFLTIHKSKGHFGTDQIRHQDHIDVCILVGDRVKDKTSAKMINDIPLDWQLTMSIFDFQVDSPNRTPFFFPRDGVDSGSCRVSQPPSGGVTPCSTKVILSTLWWSMAMGNS